MFPSKFTEPIGSSTTVDGDTVSCQLNKHCVCNSFYWCTREKEISR